jgi:hypothetical protein
MAAMAKSLADEKAINDVLEHIDSL